MAMDPKDAKSIADSLESSRKSQAEINELLEQYAKNQAKIAERSREELANLRDKIRFEQEKTKNLTDQKSIIDATVEVEKLNAEARIKDLVVLEDSLQTEIAKNDELLRAGAITREQHKTNGEILGQKIRELEEQKKIVEALHEEVQLRVESYNALTETAGTTESIVSSVFKINQQWKGTLAGKIALASKETGGFSAALKEVGQGLKSSFSSANLLGSAYTTITDSTINLAKEQDRIVSDFNRSTGAAGQYNEQLRDLGRENLSLGIDTNDASQAFESLRENFTDFTSLTKEQQNELTTLTATMNEFGVSVEDSSNIMQTLTKSMDMNVDQAMTAQREIAATAAALGESPAKLAKGFAQAAPQLAAFGKQGVQAFKDLATQAKATGLEVNRLLDIALKFDTFDSAAESVGKFNAILGGGFLDSMEMIQTTDPAERIKLLRSALDDAGQSFDQMSYYQRKAIADAAGLSDVNELSKIMSGTLEETSAAARADALSKEEMAKMAQQAQSVQEKLTAAMNAFAIALDPVVDGIRWLADGFLALKDLMGNAFAPVLLGVLVLYKSWGVSLGRITTLLNFNTTSTLTNAKAQQKQAKATSDSGKSATKSVAPMLALGAAILMIAGGVFLAATGIAQMAEAIKGMGIQEMAFLSVILVGIAAGIAFLIPALTAFATTSTVAALPILAMGAALMSVGAAFLMMAYGVKLVIDSLSNLIGTMGKVTASAGAIKSLAVGIADVATAIGKIPSENAINFGVSMDKLASASQVVEGSDIKEAVEATAQLTPTHVESVEKLVDQSERYMRSKEESRNFIFDPLLNLIQGATEAPTPPAATGGLGQRTIILQIGERQIKKVVLDVLNEQANPRKL